AIKIHLGRLLGERKLRAADVARDTGINKNTLSSLYHEKVSGIRFETLETLCRYFDCSVEDILEYVPKEKKNSSKN
ncbi:MAG: helix-turn-helix domain-containing protein, partial [Atribacterota bacterium]